MKTRFLLALSAVCGTISGCDEIVKTTIIDGLQAGATDVGTALITALFLSISSGLDVTIIVDSANTLSALIH
ncbi:MAG: hypothetical protein GX629_10600 [Phycisphaerae bacterium]|jgi:hypothetical protein|nr:hypothetical protein [Phycisphaerae bacterium]